MKRITVSISDEIEESLDEYLQDQEVTPSLAAVVRVALEEYLAAHGYSRRVSPFRITPASKGSGLTGVSRNHDQYFSEAFRSQPHLPRR